MWGRASVSNAAIGCAPADCMLSELCLVSETIVIPVIECASIVGCDGVEGEKMQIMRFSPMGGISLH